MDIKQAIQTVCLCVVITICLGIIFSVVVVATYEEVVNSKIAKLQEERAKYIAAANELEQKRRELQRLEEEYARRVWDRPDVQEITQILDERDAKEEKTQEKETADKSQTGTKERQEEIPIEVRPDGGKTVRVPSIYVQPRWNVISDALAEENVADNN